MRRQKQLVRGIDNALTILFEQRITEALDDIYCFRRRVLVVQRYLRKSFTVFGRAERHYRYTLHSGDKRGQIGQCATQMLTVVPAAAEDDLTVHGDAAVRHLLYIPQNISGKTVAEHLLP